MVGIPAVHLSYLLVACLCGDDYTLSDMPLNRLNEPTKPYQLRYNSTPVKPSYGGLVTLGPAVRVRRGSIWAPAVPVRDIFGNSYYVLKTHLDANKCKGVAPGRGMQPLAPFKSKAMRVAWLKRYLEMWRRCTCKGTSNYENYGGKGVTVYPGWKDRDAFFAYIAELPGWDDPSKQLDRRDNSRGYEPGNLRFSTRTENIRNRSNTVMVDLNGAEVPLALVTSELWPWYPLSYAGLHWRNGKSVAEIDIIAHRYKTRKASSW